MKNSESYRNERDRQLCINFINTYYPVFADVDPYLKEQINASETRCAEAYKHLREPLHELCVGIYQLTFKEGTPEKEGLMNAVNIFSLQSSAHFIYDICVTCETPLKHDWCQQFNQDILVIKNAISHLGAVKKIN